MLNYIQELKRSDIPSWLLEIANSRTLPRKLPLESILDASCFYPASRLDTDPIHLTAGNVYSFILCDYGVKQKEFLAFMEDGILGYNLIAGKFVEKNEIVPDFWTPELPIEFDDVLQGYGRLHKYQAKCDLFGHWSVWEQKI